MEATNGTEQARSVITDMKSYNQYITELVEGNTEVAPDVLVDKAISELSDAEKAIAFPIAARQSVLTLRTTYLQRVSRDYADNLASTGPKSVQVAPKPIVVANGTRRGQSVAITHNTNAPSQNEILKSYRNTHNPSRGDDQDIALGEFTEEDIVSCERYFREQGNTYLRRADWYSGAATLMAGHQATTLGAVYDEIVTTYGAHQ